MSNSLLKTLLTASAVVLAAQQGAVAADANHPEASFRTIVNMGFRVVSTEAIPAEAAEAVGMNHADAITIVTLENGPAVAVCTFSTKAWVFMSDGDLEAATVCDYRDYSSATPPAAPVAATPAPPAAAAPPAPAAPAAAAPTPATPAAPAPAAPDSGKAG
jgi:hypothetical protein